MNKLIAQTLIASSVAFAALAPAHAADQAKERTNSVGQYVDDTTITAKVKAKHAEDKMVSAMGVSVETKQGVVILSGKANSADEKQRAEQLARQVEGVKSISNKIDVAPAS